MAGFTVGNTNIFTSNTFSATFNGLTVNNQLVFEDTGSHFQGETSGFVSGGATPSASTKIESYPFSSDTNATDVGDLSQARGPGQEGNASATNGYASGGYLGPGLSIVNDKFPFAISGGTATNIGDLDVNVFETTGQSSTTDGYQSGGGISVPVTRTDDIQKFPFATDVGTSLVANMTTAKGGSAGGTSATNGYVAGGISGSSADPLQSSIEKFPFASDTSTTATASLAISRTNPAGQSSTVAGYVSGGRVPPPRISAIEKYSFANDIDGTFVGDLSEDKNGLSGSSSTTDGYTNGGNNPPFVNTIERFPFSAETPITDVGNLTEAKDATSGTQV